MADQDVAVSFHEMDTVPATSHHHSLEYRLHGPDQLKAIGLNMHSFYLNVFDRRHPLTSCDIARPTSGIARATMSADKPEGRPLPRHHHSSHAPTIDAKRTVVGKVDLYG